jgi:hypothetical protein
MENIEVLELKKDSIVALMKRYRKEFIKIDDSLDLELCGSAGNSFFNIKFDIKNDKYLYIKDVITVDNISLYYEFMSDEDLEKYRVILRNIFYDRKLIILKSLNFINSYSDEKKSHYIYDAIKKHQSFFGIKDTLKPIDEYIEQIKQSEAYKEYIAKKA